MKYTTVSMRQGRWFDDVKTAISEGMKYLKKYPDTEEIVVVQGPIKILRRQRSRPRSVPRG